MKGIMIMLMPLLLLALQLHEFGYSVNGDNTSDHRLDYLHVVDRIKRLGELLENKFIREDTNMHKLQHAEKRLNLKKDTRDTNLRLLMAKFAGYDVNKEEGAENVRAAQRFVAYIYTIIMDAWISGGTRFKDFVIVFSQMRNLKEILEKQGTKVAKYLKSTEPMPKGVSDWGLFYMWDNQLDQIIKLHAHEKKRREQKVGNDKEEESAYAEEKKLNTPANGVGYKEMLARVTEVVQLLHDLLLDHVNSDGKCAIFTKPDAFEKIATTQLNSANKKIFVILALEQGYCPVIQTDICTEKDVANYKQKGAEKLLKLLVRFYLVVWHSWLYSNSRFKDLDQLSQNLVMVNEHYANKKDGFWHEDLQHAQTELAKQLKFYVNDKDANGKLNFPGIEEDWGWVYATDEFYSKAQQKAMLIEPKGKEKAGSSSSGRGGRFAKFFKPV